MADVDETPETPVSPNRSVGSVTDVYRALNAAPNYIRAEDDESSEDGSLGVLYGHFSEFDTLYRIDSWWEGSFMERVAKGAFKGTFERNGTNIKVMFQHGYDPSIGMKTLGKLRKIEEDKVGGYYEAPLYDTSYNRDLEPGLRAGDYGASFRFRILKQEIEEEPKKTPDNPDGLPIRTITEAEVMEVGPVVWGASPTATAAVRSMTDHYLPPEVRMLHERNQHNEEVREATVETAEDVPEEERATETTDTTEEVRQEETVEETVTETEPVVDEARNEEQSTTDETPKQEGKKSMATSAQRVARLGEIEARFTEIDTEFPDAEYSDEARTEVDSLNEERASLEAAEERHKADQAAMAARSKAREEAAKHVEEKRNEGGAQVTEPPVYRKGGENSYFKDLYRAKFSVDADAAARLRKNDAMRHEDEVRAGMTTVDGAGGEFVPPKWMMDVIELARAGRVTADQLNKQPLPADTNSISLPRVASAPTVAEHAGDNVDVVEETSITTDSVTADVKTIAGGQTVALQLIEQSPINVDTVVFPELVKAYNVTLDNFVLNNNVANARGLLNVTGIHSLTITGTTAAALNGMTADAMQRIYTNRFDAPDRIIMHPRRWAALLSAVDSTGRPLVVPVAQAPQNVIAAAGGPTAEGFVGSMQGLPVFVDPNIATNLGTGTNEDLVLVLKADDVYLYEGTPRAQAFQETKADTMSVYFRFYNYVALHSERYPKSIAKIGGAGLITPDFDV